MEQLRFVGYGGERDDVFPVFEGDDFEGYWTFDEPDLEPGLLCQYCGPVWQANGLGFVEPEYDGPVWPD